MLYQYMTTQEELVDNSYQNKTNPSTSKDYSPIIRPLSNLSEYQFSKTLQHPYNSAKSHSAQQF